MLKFFQNKSNTDIKVFATGLASKLIKRYPPQTDQQAEKRPSVNRLTRIVEETSTSAAKFSADKKLGWLGKAKLANEFRWSLSEAGYTKEFVDFATEAMVVYLNQKQASKISQ